MEKFLNTTLAKTSSLFFPPTLGFCISKTTTPVNPLCQGHECLYSWKNPYLTPQGVPVWLSVKNLPS